MSASSIEAFFNLASIAGFSYTKTRPSAKPMFLHCFLNQIALKVNYSSICLPAAWRSPTAPYRAILIPYIYIHNYMCILNNTFIKDAFEETRKRL